MKRFRIVITIINPILPILGYFYLRQDWYIYSTELSLITFLAFISLWIAIIISNIIVGLLVIEAADQEGSRLKYLIWGYVGALTIQMTIIIMAAALVLINPFQYGNPFPPSHIETITFENRDLQIEVYARYSWDGTAPCFNHFLVRRGLLEKTLLWISNAQIDLCKSGAYQFEWQSDQKLLITIQTDTGEEVHQLDPYSLY